jgi:hypothetical protein
MADQDLRHYRAPEGAIDMRSYPVAASEAFRTGEPVVLAAAGTIGECLTDPASVDGIAAHRSTDVDGTDLGVGTQITVYGTSPNQVFITRRFMVASVVTAPALTNIGDLVGLTLSGGIWYLDTGTDNLICMVDGVQDIAGNNLGDPNVLPGTGVWVLFHFI